MWNISNEYRFSKKWGNTNIITNSIKYLWKHKKHKVSPLTKDLSLLPKKWAKY